MLLFRRISALVPAFLAALIPALSSCNKSGEDTTQSQEFRVALLSPGPVNDNGWNASAWEGLLAIEAELKATKTQQQVKTPAEIETGFRRNAQKGARLLFGHGFEFGDAAVKVGREFPKAAFIVSAGGPEAVADNVASMVWRVEDAAWLCGRLAARISKTGKAGCVGGVDIPPVRSAFVAFEQGAKSVNPQFEVRQTYINNWEDIGAARAQTQSLIQAGCDTLFHDADAAGLGMLDAAEKAGVYAFGCTRDQSSSAPNAVVASATVDVKKSFLLIAREVLDGKFKGRRVEWTRREGVIGFVWNEKLKSRFDSKIIQDIAEQEGKIASGELKIEYFSK